LPEAIGDSLAVDHGCSLHVHLKHRPSVSSHRHEFGQPGLNESFDPIGWTGNTDPPSPHLQSRANAQEWSLPRLGYILDAIDDPGMTRTFDSKPSVPLHHRSACGRIRRRAWRYWAERQTV
jgi:hypothetical protein